MAVTVDRRRSPVLQSLLGGGMLYLTLFLVVHAYLAVTSDGFAWTDVLLLVLTGAPQTVLVLRGRLEVGRVATAAICVSVAVAVVIGVALLPADEHAEGYTAWFMGAVAFNLLALTVVGRFAAAWATLGLVAVITVGWSILSGAGLGVGIGLVVRHAATLLVGTGLAYGLRRSTAAFTVFRAVERRRAAEEAASRARAAARRSAAESVLEQAGPMLRAVADGRPLTEHDRLEMLVIEGALRDQIRTPRLLQPMLREASAAARRRGVNVLLLDEAESAPRALRERSARWLAEQLGRSEGSRFVGRMRAADGGVRVSAVTDDGQRESTFV